MYVMKSYVTKGSPVYVLIVESQVLMSFKNRHVEDHSFSIPLVNINITLLRVSNVYEINMQNRLNVSLNVFL